MSTTSAVRLITVGVDRYDKAKNWNVAEARTSRDTIASLLAEHGATVEDWTPEAKTVGRITVQLDTWVERLDLPTIIYWIGHGGHSNDGYVLALADSTCPLHTRNSLTGRALAEAVRDRQHRREEGQKTNWVLLILDSCGSRPGADRIWELLPAEQRTNTGVIGTAEDGGAAWAGKFTETFDKALREFNGNDDGVSIKELMRRLEDALEGGEAPLERVHHLFSPVVKLPARRGTPPPLQAPVDVYAELSSVLTAAPPQLRNHFYAKAQGAEIGELAWHFTGREAERRTIVNWLRDQPGGMFVVSGIAGSGKSAVLGMLLASSDPNLTSALKIAGYKDIPVELRPTQPADAVVHLNGQTITDAVRAISTGLGLEPTDNPDTLVDTARRTVAAGARTTVVLDALDEARDPLAIAGLLRRLADIPQLRLLIGSRQSLHEDPDTPTPPDSNVLDALTTPASTVIKLQRDPLAARRYAHDRLRRALPDADRDHIDDLAEQIAAVDAPFLFARLAVHEIIADPAWATPGADLTGLLSSGHSGIFTQAVTRLHRRAPVVEALLHALAYARGNGFPRTDGIWAIAASALIDTPVTDRDVSNTLEIAAPYIMQDTEFGHSVYRLAHRTFTERYRKADSDAP